MQLRLLTTSYFACKETTETVALVLPRDRGVTKTRLWKAKSMFSCGAVEEGDLGWERSGDGGDGEQGSANFPELSGKKKNCRIETKAGLMYMLTHPSLLN